jgi:hypothetical protein
MNPSNSQQSPDVLMAARAARQSGVVSIEQLYRLGFSLDQVKTRVRRGQLHRIYDGVYAVGHRDFPLRGRLLAALFVGGDDAFLSHRTAGGLRGVCALDPGRIELTVIADRTPRAREGLVFHRTTTLLDEAEVGRHRGLRTATVPRVLVDLAAKASAVQIEELIAEAVRNDVFEPLAFEAALLRHSSRRGVARLRAVADYYRPLPDRKSEFERDWDREHAKRPEIPPCERNVVIDGWEIDCCWRTQGVALELDGRRYHTALQDFEKDRRKDTALQLMRLKPMRAGYWMFKRDKEQVIRDLLGLLALGRA